MSEVFSIQIHNRKLFEQGGQGVWVELPTTADKLWEAMKQIGISTDNQQDFFINGYSYPEDRRLALPYDMVLAADVDELNYLAARLEPLAPAEIAELNAAAQAPRGGFESIGQIIDYPDNVDFYVHIPEATTPAQLGDYYLHRSGMVQMPEEWKAGIDPARFGQHVAQQEQGAFTPYGYLVKSGDEWQRVHEGQPVPEEYRVMGFPPPEAERDEGRTTAAPAAVEPPPVVPIVLTSTNNAERMKVITDKLEAGIQALFESEKYKAYLTTMSKFHSYSFNNTLLIAMQGGSLVAGYNKWRDEFERHVKKGEVGIKILAPAPFKATKQQRKLDPATGQPIIGKDGKPVTEEVEVTIPAFKVVSVFDVSQTEGKELPLLAAKELTGDVEQYRDFFTALEKVSPVPIAFEKIEGSAHGYYHLEDRRIAIDEGMSELQTLKTAIHEIAHAKLHAIDKDAPAADRPDQRTREVQAESVAYTICQHYGLDTSDYSFGYVAGWSSGRDLKELKASLETIRATANDMINEIDGHLAELQQQREAAQQRPAMENADPEQQQAISDTVQDGAVQKEAEPTAREWGFYLIADLKTWATNAADKSPLEHFATFEEAKARFDELRGEPYNSEPGDLNPDGQPYARLTLGLESKDGMSAADILHVREGQNYLVDDFTRIDALKNDLAVLQALSRTAREIGFDRVQGYERGEDGRYRPAPDVAFSEWKNPYYEVITPEPEPEQATYTIYQLKRGEELRDYRFEPYDRLQAAGLSVIPENYEQVYSAPLATGMTLENIYEKFNIDHPADFRGHSLSVSDIVVLHQGGKDTAHYCDSFGFQEVPEFLRESPLKAAELTQEQNTNMIDGVLNNMPTASEKEAKEKTGEQLSFSDLTGATGAEQKEAAPTETAPTYYKIDEAAARRAKEMNSFSDYTPGSATAEYRQYVDEAVQIAERQKKRVDPMYHEKIDHLLDLYCRKLAENMNHRFAIDARVPSVLIAGPSNFPVRQKEKQNAARDTNMREWQNIRGLLDKIRSVGMGGISADDPQAVKKLQDKLASLEQAQETMKAVNAYYRKNKTLDGCTALSPENIEKLKADMAQSWRTDPKPFESWALSNNNAEIRRVKERIETLTRSAELGYVGWEFDGGRVEANQQDNRLQIFFEGKPDEATRDALKGEGFRWSPRAGAWQRQLNDNAIRAADRIKYIQPLTGEKPTQLQLKARREKEKPSIREMLKTGKEAQEPKKAAPEKSHNNELEV